MGLEKGDYSFNEAMAVFADNEVMAIWELDVADNEWYVNEAAARILGCTSGRFRHGMEEREHFIAQESFIRMREILVSCLAGIVSKYEESYRVHHNDGQIIWVKEFGVVSEYAGNGTPQRITALLFDISEEKRQVEGLQADQRYREYLSHISGIGGWEYDIVNNRMYFNDDYQKLLGLLPEEMEGDLSEVCERMVHPEDRKSIMGAIMEYISQPAGIFDLEVRFRHREGHYIWLQDTGMVTSWDDMGKPVVMTGAVINIDSRKKKEQNLQETSIAMFDSNPHVNLLFDEDGSLIDSNPEAVRLFGFTSELELMEHFDRSIFKESLDITLREGEHNYETDLTIQGGQIPFHIFCKRIPYNGHYAMVAYLIDVRKIKETQMEVERRNQLLFTINYVISSLMSVQPELFEDALKHSMQIIGEAANVDRMRIWKNFDAEGKLYCKEIYQWIAHKNSYDGKQHITMLNYDDMLYFKKKFVGRDIISAHTDQLPEQDRKLLSAQGIYSVLAMPIYLQDQFWGFISYNNCQSERIFSDVEEKMLISGGNGIVSAMVRNESMSQLIEAREVAIRSSQAKTEFLSRMSHEIRTPMNAIIGMTAIAKRTNDWDKLNDCLEKIDTSSHQLLGIINDILDMSKIDANKFEINKIEFDFEKMIQNVRNVIQVKMEEKQQKFIYDFDKVYERKMIGDELRLSQVLLNLLSNAVKFTPDCETIILKVREIKPDMHRSRIRMEVIDNGIGIAKDRQQDLFQSFEQADGSITRQFGGTGLGLAISKKIIHLMGGEIWVESVEGEGSSFIVEIEVEWGNLRRNGSAMLSEGDNALLQFDSAQKEDTREESIRMEQIDWSGKHLLLVEDIEINQEILINLLEETGVEIDVASDGMAAIHKYSAAPEYYDLILMDVQMPVLDGISATKKIRSLPFKSAGSIPIIAMTANAFKEDEQGCIKAGMNAHLAKPIEWEKVLAMLARYL